MLSYMKKLSVFISVTLVFTILTGCEQSASDSIIIPSPTTTITPTVSPNPTATPVPGNDAHKLVPMTFQLSQEQVKAMFGDKYVEMNDPQGSEAKIWRYDIQPSKDYKPEGQAIDVNGIENGNLKGQVFVTWSVERKLISIASHYLLNGKVIESRISESELKKAYSDKKKLGDNEPGNDVRNPMSLQLTKEQIQGMFGDNYTEVIDAMTGEWKVWRYDIQPKSGYKSDYDIYKNGVVDESGLKSQTIKAQAFVTWDPNGKLIGLSCLYLKNGSMSDFGLNEYTLIQVYGQQVTPSK